MLSVRYTRVPCTLCSCYVSLRVALYIVSVFYGLMVLWVRLCATLSSLVIGMAICSTERIKRSKSSIRSKCHRVIGIFAFSLFMMHVQGSVPNYGIVLL